MLSFFKRYLFIVILLLIVGLNFLPVFSQTYAPSGIPTEAPGTDVSVGVPDTHLILTGCASPNALIQIFNDNVLAGAVTANGKGRFSKVITVTNANAGLHTLKLYYQDANNRTSSVVDKVVNLTSQADTNVDILLPTTIEHSPEPVSAGDYLIFRGSTCPGALVNVNLDNNLTLAARGDSKGNWYVIANTENYYVGGHIYDALSSLNAQVSSKTQKYQFNVSGPGQYPGEPPSSLDAPVITEPPDLFLSSSDTVTVRGTGPLNAQIELFIDDNLSGSLFTNANGEWSFVMKLNRSLTTVTARSCYFSNCGDFSNSVRIRYVSEVFACEVSFRLTDYRYWGLSEQDGIDLAMLQLEGSKSFEALIDWGDATVEHLSVYSDSLSKFHHVYDVSGQYNGTITLSDGQGCQSVAYFSVLVGPGAPPNWWLLAIIPMTGVAVYLVSQLVNAYQDQEQEKPIYQPDKDGRPAGWPTYRPWPKPAYGQDDKESSKDDPDKTA